ncbi:MAG: FAD-dependent oxidoreductase [Deltaproteobacteria bacterium]|nr:FAD-dependent oxidoreductase [Deltaproteobacteria bacterium]
MLKPSVSDVDSAKPRRILIVGGVAGGASCATRLRRLDEHADIVVFERGPHVSFANCGLPYYVGDVIKEEAKLLVATPELFRTRFAIDVRPMHDVLRIDREKRTIEVKRRSDGVVTVEAYDKLVLATGAAPIRPPLPGIDLPGIFAIRTVPDARAVRTWIDERKARHALVVGGGFIGCEMAENLQQRGLTAHMVELAQQIMPPFDPEMALAGETSLRNHGVEISLGVRVESFTQQGERIAARLSDGTVIETDLVILAIGIRPESALAREAGLAIGTEGHIRVDGAMRTSDPSIYAVGDAVEVNDVVTGNIAHIPLAGPANRQGRIAADALCGRSSRFRGLQGTAVCGIFETTLAMTGETEKSLLRRGITDYSVAHVHPGHHVGYFPGARPMHLKLIFRPSDGRILGAQCSGEVGPERRIDVIASFIQMRGTVFDLEEAELCYAPQFGAAKDPVNMVGMVAANAVRGDLVLAPWINAETSGAVLLDVRDPDEIKTPLMPGILNIPIAMLRDRLDELPRDRDVWVTCAVGQRAYNATRILRQHGIRAALLTGGARTLAALRGARLAPSPT